MTRANTSPRPRPDLDPIQNGQGENRTAQTSPHVAGEETPAQGTISPPRPIVPHLAPGTPPPISPPRPSPLGDGGEGAHLENRPTSPLGIDWEERLRQGVEKTLRQRADRREEREQKTQRRDAGLVQRHARKVGRLKAAALVDESGTRCRYLVSEEPPRLCPNERLPGAELCSPHLTRAVQLARRLGLDLP